MKYAIVLLVMLLTACGSDNPAASGGGGSSAPSTYSQLVGGTWIQAPGANVGDMWYHLTFYANHQADVTVYQKGAGGVWSSPCVHSITERGSGAMQMTVVSGACTSVAVTYTISGNAANACIDGSCAVFTRI